MKSKAIRWQSSYTGKTLLCPLLEAFFSCKKDLQTAEHKDVGTGCNRFVHLCLDIIVRGSNAIAKPSFSDLTFGPSKEVCHVFCCTFKVYIVL